MQDARALNNGANLSSWKAWEGEAYRRSGFAAILSGVFALMLAFVFSVTVFAGVLGDDVVSKAVVGLMAYLGISFALMGLAVVRLNAWKRAHPWTPPS